MLAGLDKSGTTHTNAGDLPQLPLDVYRLQRQLQRHLRAPSTTRSTRRTPTAGSISGYSRHLRRQPRTPPAATCKGVDGTTVLAVLDLSGTTHSNAGDYNATPGRSPTTPATTTTPGGTVHDQIDKANADAARSAAHVTYDGSPHTASGTCKGVDGRPCGPARRVGHDPHQRRRLPSDPGRLRLQRRLQRHLGTSTTRSTRRKRLRSIAATASPTTAARTPATGSCRGVDGTTVLPGLDKSGTTHTNAGDYARPLDVYRRQRQLQRHLGHRHDQMDKANADCSSSAAPRHLRRQPTHRQGQVQGRRRHDRAGRARKSGTTHTNAGDYLSEPWTFTDLAATTTTPRHRPRPDRQGERQLQLDRRPRHLQRQPAHRQRHLQGVDGTTVWPGSTSRARPHRRGYYLSDLDVYRLQPQLQRHLGTVTTRSTRRTPTAAGSAATHHLQRQPAHRKGHLQARRRHDVLAGLDKSARPTPTPATRAPLDVSDSTGDCNDTSAPSTTRSTRCRWPSQPITGRRRTTAIRLPASLERSRLRQQ